MAGGRRFRSKQRKKMEPIHGSGSSFLPKMSSPPRPTTSIGEKLLSDNYADPLTRKIGLVKSSTGRHSTGRRRRNRQRKDGSSS